MSRYATFVIDKEMDQGEETIQHLAALVGVEGSQVVAATAVNEIMRVELIESLFNARWTLDELTPCVREILGTTDPEKLNQNSPKENS